MANCGKCGKPLIIKSGKCIYCGNPVQYVTTSDIPEKKLSADKQDSSTHTDESFWNKRILRKNIIFGILALVLGVGVLIINPWPGCLVSVGMLALAVTLGVYSFLIQVPKVTDKLKAEMHKTKLGKLFSHMSNIILIWGFFFFIVGIVCIFINWWSVLIAEIINLDGLFFVIAYLMDKYDDEEKK